MNIIKHIVNIVLSAAISIGCVELMQYNYNKDFSIISSAAELDFKTSVNDDGTIAVTVLSPIVRGTITFSSVPE